MKLIAIFVFLGCYPLINAQKNSGFLKIDQLMLQIPDSCTKSTTSIANYINANFDTQTSKSRAIFIWIAKNIKYDVQNMYAVNYYQNVQELIDKVLKTRKGICMHYAELFNDIANKVGVKTYVISGYTKQNGTVDNLSHTWVACCIDSEWFLIDPTWGTGYIQNSKFITQINNFYFKTKPDQLIKSHMPFDPLWQFLNYPVTNQEFYDDKFQMNKKKAYFNFSDTLMIYEKLTNLEKLNSSARRIEGNGLKNSLIYDRLEHIKREIEYVNNKLIVEKYNNAVLIYNEGVEELNFFINYRNKQFIPKKPDAEIKQMVNTAENSFNVARNIISELKNIDSNMDHSIYQLNKNINVAMSNLNEQKAFVEKYLKSGKLTRKSLFYKFTWTGSK